MYEERFTRVCADLFRKKMWYRIYHYEGRDIFYNCPRCDATIENEYHKHCHNCGQRLGSLSKAIDEADVQYYVIIDLDADTQLYTTHCFDTMWKQLRKLQLKYNNLEWFVVTKGQLIR